MSGAITRKFAECLTGWRFTDEQRARAREHLKAAGYDVDRTPPLIWPEDAISAWQDHNYAPWQFKYKSDVLAEKRQRMEWALWEKREFDRTEIRALYLWVFWCPGISGIFEGWWTYVYGVGEEYHGGGYKGDLQGALLEQAKEMFPVANPRPLFPLDHYDWMPLFAKQYQRGKWCGKPQGKAPFWAEVRDGRVRKIIRRAEWPKPGSIYKVIV